jgi:hypothetical protein
MICCPLFRNCPFGPAQINLLPLQPGQLEYPQEETDDGSRAGAMIAEEPLGPLSLALRNHRDSVRPRSKVKWLGGRVSIMNRIAIAAAFAWLGIGASPLSGSDVGPGALTRYPTFGVAFKAPNGWHEQMRTKAKTLAWWISPDSAADKPAALIMIECSRTPARSMEEAARGLAKNFDGAVADRPTTLGGERALRVVAKNEGPNLRPVEGLVVMHDGLLYLVMGGVTAGHSVADEMEAIRASWSWMPFEPLYKHLEFRDRPLLLPGGPATINVPRLMHTYPTEHPDRILDLALPSARDNKPHFLAYVQIVPMPEGQTFEEYKNRLVEGLRAQFKLKEPLEWRSLRGDVLRVVSQPFEVQTMDKVGEPTQTLLMQWGIVKLEDRRLISVNFTIDPEDKPGRNAYIAVVDRIVDSIHRSAGQGQVKVSEVISRGKSIGQLSVHARHRVQPLPFAATFENSRNRAWASLAW